MPLNRLVPVAAAALVAAALAAAGSAAPASAQCQKDTSIDLRDGGALRNACQAARQGGARNPVTLTEARHATKRATTHVAYTLISKGAYAAGVDSCKRTSPSTFTCVGYFLADDVAKVKCTQRYLVARDSLDDVVATYVVNSTRCRKAK